MIKFEHAEVVGWEHAIRGMRNPMNSWDKSDSYFLDFDGDMYDILGNHAPFYGDDNGNGDSIGKNDHKLMMSLSDAGPVHGKFRRMIVVYVDITAPLYWWKEFDTYKVGTVSNSCSTMHKIHAKEFTLDDFSHEHLIGNGDYVAATDYLTIVDDDGCEIFWTSSDILQHTIDGLNFYRKRYLETKDKPMKEESKRAELMKKYWRQLIQLLPSSYNQRRTIMLNYEVLANIYKYRKDHKLDEWRTFCEWIEKLPHSEVITGKWEEEK